jgi:hypothetical protein
LQVLTISGHLVDCNGQSLPNGYARLNAGNFPDFAFTDANGNFEFNTFICNGTPQSSGAVTGFDLVNLLESAPMALTFPPYTVDAGDLVVCNALSEYIRYSLDGGQEIVKLSPSGGLDVNFTSIASQDSIAANQNIHFAFTNSGQTGTFPLNQLNVNSLSASDLGTLVTNVTAYGPNVGDLMIGTISGSFQTSNGANHTITGNYRVKRDW